MQQLPLRRFPPEHRQGKQLDIAHAEGKAHKLSSTVVTVQSGIYKTGISALAGAHFLLIKSRTISTSCHEVIKFVARTTDGSNAS